MAKRVRGFESLGDMVRSMAVVLVVVAFIAGLVVLYRPRTDPVRALDWRGPLTQARTSAPYAVLGPEALPDTWRSTAVTYERSGGATQWHLAFVSPKDTYVGLDQTDADAERFLAELLRGWREDGASLVRGQTWQRRVEPGDAPDHALVLIGNGVTTVVMGSGDYVELDGFASSLR